MVLGGFQGDAIRNIVGNLQFRACLSTNIANIASTYPENGDYKNGAFSATFENGEIFQYSLLTQLNNEMRKNSLINFNASNIVPTAAENRPKSTSLNYYIYVY